MEINNSAHVWVEEHELSVCKVCGLYEGGLTTDCSGENSIDKSDEIYGGLLDFRKDLGWVKSLNPTNQSWVYGKIFGMKTGRTGAAKHKNEIMLDFGIDKEQYAEIEKRLTRDLYKN